MPRLTPLQQRVVLVALTVLAGAIILGVMGHTLGSAPLPPSKWDDKLLTLDEAALEQAYRQHVVNMFLIWMKDSAGQPTRALNGVNQARRAYVEAMDEIERRRVVPLPPARP